MVSFPRPNHYPQLIAVLTGPVGGPYATSGVQVIAQVVDVVILTPLGVDHGPVRLQTGGGRNGQDAAVSAFGVEVGGWWW